MKKNNELVFANIAEEKVYKRGVSAGYFDIQIEDTSDLDEKYLAFYNSGLELGTEKLQNQEPTAEYINRRYSYILTLGYWSAMGEIIALPKSLEKEEKAYFKLGYHQAKQELLKREKMSIDDYLESKRKTRKIGE